MTVHLLGHVLVPILVDLDPLVLVIIDVIIETTGAMKDPAGMTINVMANTIDLQVQSEAEAETEA